MHDSKTDGNPNLTERALYERVRVMEASRFWKLRNIWHGLKARLHLSNGALPPFPPQAVLATAAGAYDLWRGREAPRPSDLRRMRETSRAFGSRPTLSVVVPTFDTPDQYLRATLDSVLAQAYEQWELCIADDASTAGSVRATLSEYVARDQRIRAVFRPENGRISRATNSALELATGDFVVFLDHDDLLAPEALYEIALLLNAQPEIDIIYSDEDKVDDLGHLYDPHFKPDWCPESFLSRMYIGHLVACRRTLVERVGRMRPQFDGSQDYDLLLRLTERTDRIRHIPQVLYHWRVHAASTASSADVKPYATDAAVRALNQALERRGEPGAIDALPECPGAFSVHFAIRSPRRVSVIVPTRDNPLDLERCLESALQHTAYEDLEIVVVDNGSKDPVTVRAFDAAERRDSRVRVIHYDVPFNFSAINNYAASQATGDYLLFLNDDTEVVSESWIENMLEHAQRPPIGAVGALLLYPDGSVQHAGVVVGLGGVAGHSHKYYPADSPGYYYMLKTLNNYSAVTAACMMTRRQTFERAGGFDESLAVAFNDVDLCLRLREAGYRNVYVPHVVLVHKESKSRGPETTPEKLERFANEIAIMKARWPLLSGPDPCYNRNLTLDREDFSLAP